MHSGLDASLGELPRALALTAGKGICLISEPCSLKQHFQSDLRAAGDRRRRAWCGDLQVQAGSTSQAFDH